MNERDVGPFDPAGHRDLINGWALVDPEGAEMLTSMMSRFLRSTASFTVAAVVVFAPLAACGDEDASGPVTTGTTTTGTKTTSTTAESTTTTMPEVASPSVVWPPVDGSKSYDGPVEAATGFATEFVGFSEPLVGEFQQGDSRSGEVEVRGSAGGPVTTVMVRQVGPDDTWSVLGAVTDGIRPTSPEPYSQVASPVELRGTSTSFEGAVLVAVRERSAAPPLGEGMVTGGSNGDFGSFDSTLEFAAPSTSSGAVVYYVKSAKDGGVTEAAVVPVRFVAG